MVFLTKDVQIIRGYNELGDECPQGLISLYIIITLHIYKLLLLLGIVFQLRMNIILFNSFGNQLYQELVKR